MVDRCRENRDRERPFVNFEQLAHRGRGEREEGKKDMCLLKEFHRKDRKIEKPDVQGECRRNRSRK